MGHCRAQTGQVLEVFEDLPDRDSPLVQGCLPMCLADVLGHLPHIVSEESRKVTDIAYILLWHLYRRASI